MTNEFYFISCFIDVTITHKRKHFNPFQPATKIQRVKKIHIRRKDVVCLLDCIFDALLVTSRVGRNFQLRHILLHV